MKKIFLSLFLIFMSLTVSFAGEIGDRFSVNDFRIDKNGNIIHTGGSASFSTKVIADEAALKPTVTFVIAAASSRGKNTADYICDGTADEVQINAAITALPIDGGSIQLLEGKFYVANPISITKSGVKITGSNIEGTQIFLANSANCDMLQCNVATQKYFFLLRDLTCDGNKANNTSGRGFYDGAGANKIVDVHIENVFFTNFKGIGIQFDNAWGALINKVIVEYGGNIGILINAGTDAKINNCKILENDNSAIHITHANKVEVTNNYLAATTACYGILLAGVDSSSNTIIANTIIPEDTGGTAIRISGDKNLVSNNYIDGGSTMDYGIHLTATANDNFISDNVVLMDNTEIYDEGSSNIIIHYMEEGVFSLPEKTEAELKAFSPTRADLLYTDTTNHAVIISTGTGIGAFGLIYDGTTLPTGW